MTRENEVTYTLTEYSFRLNYFFNIVILSAKLRLKGTGVFIIHSHHHGRLKCALKLSSHGQPQPLLKRTITSSKREFICFLHIISLYPLNAVTLKVAPYASNYIAAGNKSINLEIRLGKIGHLSGKFVALIRLSVGFIFPYSL